VGQQARLLPPESRRTLTKVKRHQAPLLQIVDAMAFPIDTGDREQMLKILNSCIGTKYTARFGTLMAVRACMFGLYPSAFYRAAAPEKSKSRALMSRLMLQPQLAGPHSCRV
jgi:hypothetical protein